MIVFWILFLLIILISLMLAYLSMRDFEEGPDDFGPDNGLFLVRKQNPLTNELLGYLYKVIRADSVILSIERLFNGDESALVIYGPKKAISALTQALDLLELEDYTNVQDPTIWQMGTKTLGEYHKITKSMFLDFPKLEKGEQAWFQLVLQLASRSEPEKAERGEHFKAQIRVVVLSADPRRRKLLSELLQSPKNNIVKIPLPFSSSQLMDFYKKRSIVGRGRIELSAGDIIKGWSL